MAAKVVNTLRGFESVQDVYVETYSTEEIEEGSVFFDENLVSAEEQSEDEEETLTMKQTHTKIVINCVYYPMVDDGEEADKK